MYATASPEYPYQRSQVTVSQIDVFDGGFKPRQDWQNFNLVGQKSKGICYLFSRRHMKMEELIRLSEKLRLMMMKISLAFTAAQHSEEVWNEAAGRKQRSLQ